MGAVFPLCVLSSLLAAPPAADGEHASQKSAASFVELVTNPPAVDYSRLAPVDPSGRLDSNGSAPAFVESHDDRTRIAFLGGTFVHRMSEYGYVETELTRLCPNRDLVFRNLGWPGDNVEGRARVGFGPSERQRSGWQRPASAMGDYGFSRMLDQIRREQPHVLLVAYGAEVAFEPNGLDAFDQQLRRLLDQLKPTGVRIVLVTPPPRIGPQARFQEQNGRLAEVASYLRQLASDRGLACVDLFGRWDDSHVPADSEKNAVPSGGERHENNLSDNGIHLNADGYRRVAHIMAQQLGLDSPPWTVSLKANGDTVATRGTTVIGKSVTEYGFVVTTRDERLPSVAGGHADPRRMRIEGLAAGNYALDSDGRRIAHADAQAWSRGVPVERGPDFEQLERLRQKILEKNRLHFYGFRPQNKAYIHLFRRHERGHHAGEIERFQLLVRQAEEEISRLRVPRNRHWELVRETDYPDHEVPAELATADLAAELAAFEIPPGFEINLFASDPMIANPINIHWDARGRMWVATSTIYPHLQPGQTPNDRIVILEDIDQDGRADKSTVFADNLLVPHSVLPGHGGVYVTQSTDLLFLRDTDGDDRADERIGLLTGFGNADVHHMIHALRWGPDGDLYFNQSIYINSFVETPWGIESCHGSCIWRLRPETLRLSKLSRGLVNPWGHAFDDWGQSFATDGAGGDGLAYAFPGSAFRTHGDYGRELSSMNPGRPKECGLEWLAGRHLPADWQGTFLTNDFRANRVTRYRVTEKESGYASEFLGDVVSSRHRAFRPVDVKQGPDGAIYIVDWYNLVIDHGEVDFHHPLRDKRHGRIWRLTVKDAPLVTPPRLAGASESEWLDALKLPEPWSRDQARKLLREHDGGPEKISPILRQWLARLDASDPRYEHHRLEALWVYQGLRAVQPDLLRDLLASADHHVRAAAVRVLGDWQNRLPDARAHLEAAVLDAHPQVRLEAVNVLREIPSRESADTALRALDLPLDENLDFALWRVARDLSPDWLPALQAGERVFEGRPDRIAFALSAIGNQQALAPLAELVRNGKLNPRQKFDTLRVLAALGSGRDRTLVMDQLEPLTAGQQADVMASLLEAPRGELPDNAAKLIRLIQSSDSRLRQQAMRLAARWQMREAVEPLDQIAHSPDETDVDRRTAARALVQIDPEDGRNRLKKILDEQAPQYASVRATALAGWAAVDVSDAAARAVRFFATDPDRDLAGMVFESIIGQRAGSEKLVAALSRGTIPEAIAAEGVRVARESGQNTEILVEALVRAGGLRPVSKQLSPDEFASILAAVGSQGDALRGELVFRRQELNCMACHAIGGAGGQVGPDLSSLGGSARLADLLQSVVDPSAKIKDGYQTLQLALQDGRVVSGIVTRRTEDVIQLRTAKDELLTVRQDEVEDEAAGKVSIMPVGLAQQLRRDELIDLVRYLSALGRDDGYKVPARKLVRRWQVLPASAGLLARVSEAGDQRLFSSDAAPLPWTTRFSTAAGALTAADIPIATLPNRERYGYVRIDATRGSGGRPLLTFDTAVGIQWLDHGEWQPLPAAGRLNLEGREAVILRVDLRERPSGLTAEWAP